MTAATTTAPKAGTGYRYLVVGLLAVVYTFNFMDRQILSTLAEPIRKDLHLSDTALGALGGITFALFYTTFGIPVAWLSDRFKRVWIMAAACGVWSLFTAGCGLGHQLHATRPGCGSTGRHRARPAARRHPTRSSPTISRRRSGARSSALYSCWACRWARCWVWRYGGRVAAAYGWRMAFFVVGLPGVLLALLMLLIVREPKRGGLDPKWRSATRTAEAHTPSRRRRPR